MPHPLYEKIGSLKAKKIITYSILGALTIAASTTLTFLSLGGLYTMLPIEAVAILSSVLAIAYEGTIYWDNIKSAYNKWVKGSYLENRLGREYLSKHLMEHLKSENCPQFYKDYEQQLLALEKYHGKTLDATSNKGKKIVEKRLSDMEKWFAQQWFANEGLEAELHIIPSKYAKELRGTDTWRKFWRERLQKRKNQYTMAKIFSTFSGLFMGLGMTYLFAEALEILNLGAIAPYLWPVFPFIIVATAMRDFNSITEFFTNETFSKWREGIKRRWKAGLTLSNVFYILATGLVLSLSFVLTACAGGTWWTVVQNVPLYSWVKDLPSYILGVINPLMTGVAATFFNIQNSLETIEMLEQAQNPWTQFKKNLKQFREYSHAHENMVQRWNPFRLFNKLVFLPLRILLFIGHLSSMSFSTDRVPGIPLIPAAIVAFILEFITDLHYFLILAAMHNHGHAGENQTQHLLEERFSSHGHSHDNDIPTLILRAAFIPLIAIAAAVDCAASQFNEKEEDVLSLPDAFKKHMGIQKKEEVKYEEAKVSDAWRREHGDYVLGKLQKNFSGVLGSYNSNETVKTLSTVRTELTDEKGMTEWSKKINEAKNKPELNRNRLFSTSQTTTNRKLQKLPERLLPISEINPDGALFAV